jgi:type IV pilus assembly protein PilO
VDGLRRKPILLAARGSYPALLEFLRGLEALNVLVVQSDLKLSLEDDKAKQASRSTSQPRVELKLALSLYDREATKGRARPLPSPAAAPPN